MNERQRSIEAILAYWQTDKQQLLRCCFLIRTDCESGTSAGIREIVVQSQRSTDPCKMLDRALSVLRYLPDEEKQKEAIEDYAFGRLRGRPSRVVYRFWERVPVEAVRDMAPLTVALLG